MIFSPNSLCWQEIHIYKHGIYKIIEPSHSNVVIYVLVFSGCHCRSIAVTTYPFICAIAVHWYQLHSWQKKNTHLNQLTNQHLLNKSCLEVVLLRQPTASNSYCNLINISRSKISSIQHLKVQKVPERPETIVFKDETTSRVNILWYWIKQWSQ